MKIFELVSGKPVITIEALLVPEFKKLSFNEMQYIYFASDYKSIYLSYDKETREERLRDDFIGDKKWKPTKEIRAAIEKYKDLQNTPTMRFLEANKNAMQSLTKYFNSIDWDEADSAGRPKYKVKEVTGAVKDAGAIIDNIDKLIQKVTKEQAMSGARARGTGEGGLLESTE